MVIGKGILLASMALAMGVATQPARADAGQTGLASYYWQGKGTASGERFNAGGLTAAHRSLPFNTKVKVTNLRNGRTVVVRINDRGPFVRGRIIDVSRAAASELGFTGHGITRVSVAVLGQDEENTAAPAPTSRRTQLASAMESQEPERKAEPQVNAPATGAEGWTLVPPPVAAATTAPQATEAQTP